MENKRLVEENKIFHKELQIANEAKNETDKLKSQMAKLDAFYKRKIDENLIKKEDIKVNECFDRRLFFRSPFKMLFLFLFFCLI